MSADLQIALWGVAVLLPFMINVAFGRSPDGLGLSGMLIFGWALQRVSWALWSPPEAMQLYPIMDALFASVCFGAWATSLRGWKLLLGGLLVVQCGLHVDFWANPATTRLLPYIRANNILFAVQLLVAASPGVGHGIAILARSWEPPFRRLHARAGR